MQKRVSFILAVFLFLKKDNQVLLAKRQNTGYEDGNYSTISGHIEEKETMINAVIREAYEEAKIIINENNLKLFHIMSRLSEAPRYDFFYFTKNWQGQPIINEPSLCSDLSWFDLSDLPSNTVPCIKLALQTINKNKIIYSSIDW